MTKNEELVKGRIDKIIRNTNMNSKQLDDLYGIYNTREVQEFLKWKPTWNITIRDWYNSLDEDLKTLVSNLIILFNIQPENNKRRKIKMEEIKQEQVTEQPTITVTEKVKIKRAARKGKEFYEPIMAEIDQLKSSGKKVSEIMNHLSQKYPDVKSNTLMVKYFVWKKANKPAEEVKQGE